MPEQVTDLRNAERLIARSGHLIRYSGHRWYTWDGARWTDEKNGKVMQLAIETIKAIPQEAALTDNDRERDAIIRDSKSHESVRHLEAMIRIASRNPAIIVPGSAWNKDPMLLNVRNGTIDLSTGTIRPHDPADLLTQMADVEFDSTATCPTWLSHLNRILPGPDLVPYLQKLAGYFLTGRGDEQSLWIFYGSGANGKGTLLDTLTKMMGDYATYIGSSSLMSRKMRGDARNDLARLHRKRLVTSAESQGDDIIDEGTIKVITGDDDIVARHLYEEFFTFKASFKLVLATNHPPQTRSQDHGLWRRLKKVPFEVCIPREEWDTSIKEKLQREWPGILNWCLAGLKLWLKEKPLVSPPAVEVATKEYREDEDPLSEFLEEACIMGSESEIAVSKFYAAYRKWCAKQSVVPMTKNMLTRLLKNHGLNRGHSGKARVYKGITLHPVWATELAVDSTLRSSFPGLTASR